MQTSLEISFFLFKRAQQRINVFLDEHRLNNLEYFSQKELDNEQ